MKGGEPGSRFDEIRQAAAFVAGKATCVRIEPRGLRALADSLAEEAGAAGTADPVRAPFTDPATTLAYVVTLDAVNFGSGWFPVLQKLPGRSGYMTISTRLRESFAAEGPLAPEALAALEAAECARLFGQDPGDPEVAELMELFARSLRDLGRFLLAHGGFDGLVAAADRSASRLVELLAEMPLYRDVSRYAGRRVPFYKRAQITAADLALAFAGEGPGRFDDIDALTMFADNLVPHVLRCAGALRYAPALVADIDRGALLVSGSPAEVEIRAVGLHAVEEISRDLAGRLGTPLAPRRIDELLWNRGQRPDIKRINRHRTRSPYY